MDLFRVINNEAVDEDKKAQREVIERQKKQIAMFDSPFKKTKQLSKQQEITLFKIIYDFQNTLEKTVAEHYKRNYDVSSSGEVPYKYNLVASQLEVLDFKELSPANKLKILTELDKIKPKVIQLQGIADQSKNYVDKDIVDQIANNFQNKLFLPVGISKIKKLPSAENLKTYLKNIQNLIIKINDKTKKFINKRGRKPDNIQKLLDFKNKLEKIYNSYNKADTTKKIEDALYEITQFFEENNTIINEIEQAPVVAEEQQPEELEPEAPAMQEQEQELEEEEEQVMQGQGKKKGKSTKSTKHNKKLIIPWDASNLLGNGISYSNRK